MMRPQTIHVTLLLGLTLIACGQDGGMSGSAPELGASPPAGHERNAEQRQPPSSRQPQAGVGARPPASVPSMSPEAVPSGGDRVAREPGAPGIASQGEVSAGGRASLGQTPVPCGVDAVLASSCRGCHGRQPGGQAPMSLVSHEDLAAPSISDPDTPVYALLRERVHAMGPRQMPPPGRGRPLTGAELATLDAWIDGGSQPGAENCEASGPVATPSGITYGPVDPEEIEACYEFYAHQNSTPGDKEPFVARSGEYYTAFYFDVPWEGEKQAVLFRSSDTNITHHWLLYDTPEPMPDGTVLPDTLGSHVGAPDLLAAWAINQQREQAMPKEVGLAMPVRGTGRRFLLEVHYFNSGESVPDRSGVEVCIGKQPRANTATVSWLGSEAIVLLPGSRLDLVGTCTPTFPEDIYIFRSFPHMHERGYHLKTEILRTDGRVDTLVDKPFDFNNQLMYDTPAVVHPGDQLLTTCQYENRTDRLIGIGYDSLSEMCFNFVYAWPAKALVGGVSLTGTSTPCLL